MEGLITIPESGMIFGPFAQDQVFHIEKSKIYTGRGIRDNGVQTVEFILKRTGKRISLAFVEAKSSFAKPDTESGKPFQRDIHEISEKFLHSLHLYCSALMGRHGQNHDLPESFQTLDHSQASIKLVLVIRGHTADGLDPIKTKLEQTLRAYRAIWKLEIVVMNDKMAAKRGLIRSP